MAYNKHATIPYYSKKKGLQTMKQGTLHPICLILFDAAKVQTILQTTKFCSKKGCVPTKKAATRPHELRPVSLADCVEATIALSANRLFHK